jgi:hypothetical protein
MRYKPMSSPVDTVRPMSQERHEENIAMRIEAQRQARELNRSEAEAAAQRFSDRLAEISPTGSVRDLSRRDYADTKRRALAALRGG